jgi:hypothetical protein
MYNLENGKFKYFCEWTQPIHKDTVHSIALLDCPQKHLITSSADFYFKISKALTGEVVCAYNINVI